MGMFSKKTQTYYGTSVNRVIEDDALPESVRSGLLKALFENGEVPEYVMEELVSSVGVRSERMYAYAANHYVHGLPSGDVLSSFQGRDQVEALIEQIEGKQVLIKYSMFGSPNALHIGWIKLVNQYGYVPATNELTTLSAQKGVPVYLKNMVPVVPEAQAPLLDPSVLAVWGVAANAGYTPGNVAGWDTLAPLTISTEPILSSTATSVYLEVTYVWQPATPLNAPLQEATVVVSVDDYPDADYFHAKYVVDGQTKFWIYRHLAGVYSTLDNVFVNAPVVSGEYFPFLYFRYGKQSVHTDKTSQAYLTSKKMAKYIGMDFDAISEAIDENPDIGNVEQAILMYAVPPVSTDAIECRYLFDYFDNLYYVQGQTGNYATQQIFGGLTIPPEDRYVVRIKDNQYQMELGHEGIFKSLVAGTIGPIGTHTTAYEELEVETTYVDALSDAVVTVPATEGVHRYRKQVAPGLYEQVEVRGLIMRYYISNQNGTAGEAGDEILLVPIDRSLTQQFSMGDREKLYARSLHFVFNSLVIATTKWYQRPAFRAFLIVVAIVITIVTYGQDGGSTIAAALGLSGVEGLIATIVFNLIVGQLLVSVFKLFVKVVGVEAAAVVAIIAIMYGGYELLTEGLKALPDASFFLQMATGLQQAIFQDMFSDLSEQSLRFSEYTESQTKLLESAQELLENQRLLSPFVIFGEKPEDFYNRTVHYGNIGTLSIAAVSSYVDVALTLPKLNDTLGESLNG